ncbi:MAG: metal-dependent phosphohydrolase [Treponema sp.]|nr:metal-dependent phosphohydrolase [Treponema sp.]
MAEKDIVIPLSKVLIAGDGKTNNKYIKIIEDDDIPILCVNRGMQKKRLMPFKVLHDNNINFFQKPGSWEYYLTGESYNKLKEKAIVKHGSWEFEMPWGMKEPEFKKKDDDIEELDAATADDIASFGSEYKAINNMTLEEKVSQLNKDRDRLDEILADPKSFPKNEIAEVLVDTTKNAALVNHAALEDAIHHADDEAKKLTQGLVDSTHDMIKSSAKLISDDIFGNDLMSTLVEKSNGTIIQHMTRVYLNGIAFLAYYNKLISESSAIQKMRISFASKYRDYYRHLLPHIHGDDIDLERVFFGGMRVIPPELFNKWAVGFLIHDIGKGAAVEYHEGEEKYNRQIVIDHVKQGYKSIMTKTNYPMEASLITGYHHEYYGDRDGYGYFRAYLTQYKKDNPHAKPDYCMTYELEPILDYHALAYFPAKVLEIIDVYDSVTDPNRVYRKAMKPEEAINMMREQFVEQHHKIDVVLFDIFSKFIYEKERINKK